MGQELNPENKNTIRRKCSQNRLLYPFSGLPFIPLSHEVSVIIKGLFKSLLLIFQCDVDYVKRFVALFGVMRFNVISKGLLLNLCSPFV